MGFNHKYIGRTITHILEVFVNLNGRCFRITDFMTIQKITFVVIPKGYKSWGWIVVGEALTTMMLYPSHFVGNKRFHKVAMEEVKLVSNPIKLSFASVVVGEGSRKQGYEPMGRWARAVVYKPSPAVASVGRIAIGRAFAKVVGMKGVIGITRTSENQGIFFVESTDLAIYLHEKRFILVSEKIKVKVYRWNSNMNATISGWFRKGWIEVRGLPLRLWYEIYLFHLAE